jgi:hypothetical protein
MKSIKEIMAELGFNADAPIETQKAFLRNLIAASEATLPKSSKIDSKTPTMVQNSHPNSETQIKKQDKGPVHEQLAFDFSKINRVS